MPQTHFNIAETTDSEPIISIIDDALRSLYISGSLLLRDSFVMPWSIYLPDSLALAKLLNAGQDKHVVVFHLVEFGQCTIKPKRGRDIHLKAGEMVINFGGAAHQLIQGTPNKVQSIEALLADGPNISGFDGRTGAEGAALLSGVFMLQHTRFNPLYESLPPFMHIRLSQPGELHNLSGVARLMTEQMDEKSIVGSYVVERTIEILCAEAIRAYVESPLQGKAQWLDGICDPVIGRVIAAIHASPSEHWSVQRMANNVAMSPSRLAARFAKSVGDSPMAYLTKWRMNLACRMLVDSNLNIDQIGVNIGYESAAAFSRTFKKYLGMSTVPWRSQRTATSAI